MQRKLIEIGTGDKILLVQLRAMGDTLLTTPLIRSLKRKYPGCAIDILVEPLPAQVLRNNPYLNKIHIAPLSGSGFMAYRSSIKRLRSERYKLAVDFLSTPGSALLTRMSGAQYRIGYRLRGRSWAYTHPAERRTEPLYNPLTKFDLVKLLNIETTALPLDIILSKEDEQKTDEVLSELHICPDTILYSLAPWSKREWRRWSMKAWLELIKEIQGGRKITWLLFASPGERAGLTDLESEKDLDIRWAGTKDLIITAGLMKKTEFMLCSDNGLKHIAVAMDVPSLTIYTGSDPRAWHPPESRVHSYIESEPEPLNVGKSIHSAMREYEKVISHQVRA